MNNPLLSVIVPAYNADKWLSDCIESIINQTYTNLEIIIINDGSTDNTGKMIDQFAKKDLRIVPIHQQNIGLVMTREKGIKLANGQYTTFVDADDTIQADMYERLIKNILKYDADISHCGVNFCWDNGVIEPHYGSNNIKIQDNFNGLKDLLEGKMIEPSLCNKIYKTKILYNSCIDTSILNNEDLLRNFVLFERSHKSVYEDFCGYNYFQREGSMSKDKSKAILSHQNIFKARQIIVENSNQEIYPYAMGLWLNSSVNAINIFTFEENKEFKDYFIKNVSFLKQHKKDLHYLCKSQRFAAYLVIISPYLHRFVYRLYKKL